MSFKIANEIQRNVKHFEGDNAYTTMMFSFIVIQYSWSQNKLGCIMTYKIQVLENHGQCWSGIFAYTI